MDQAENLRNVIKLNRQRQASAPNQNARVITVTSGKGGVGKSNLTVNLAVHFRKMGKRVLIFDADFGLANVEVMFGTIPKYNLADLIFHGKSMREIISEGPMGIGFISGGSGILGMNQITDEQLLYFIRCLKELDTFADVIIIDTGAGISDQVLEFILVSQEVLLVTTPDPSSLTDAYSLLKTLYCNPGFQPESTEIKIVSNRVSSVNEGRNVYDRLNYVVAQFLHGKIDYLGMIPQDSMLEKSVRQQKPVSISMPEAKSAQAFAVLASNLVRHEQNQPRLRRGLSQMFSGLFNHKF